LLLVDRKLPKRTTKDLKGFQAESDAKDWIWESSLCKIKYTITKSIQHITWETAGSGLLGWITCANQGRLRKSPRIRLRLSSNPNIASFALQIAAVSKKVNVRLCCSLVRRESFRRAVERISKLPGKKIFNLWWEKCYRNQKQISRMQFVFVIFQWLQS
jgi:hypothetical protein